MNCKWVESRLSSYLDGELSGAEMQKARSHMHTCESCSSLFEDLRLAKSSVEALPTCDMPDDFEERLVAKVFASESAPARRRFTLAWVGGLAFAAAFAFMTVWLQADRARQIQAGTESRKRNFELARDQAYFDGFDSLSGSSAVLTSSHDTH